ncbi:hypothetical protein AAG570_007493 [Ranatra chinensis]|uniref:HTH psq-type domain-containing protein n=1 Tax=Ranatra chinensis TaxID=642074 RepID=A0ABD0XWC2_9HEMI
MSVATRMFYHPEEWPSIVTPKSLLSRDDCIGPMKGAASSKPSQDKTKCQRKTLTVQEKVRLLDMIKYGKQIVEVACHFNLNESTIRYIRKEEKKIRTTASITFNKKAKRVVTSRNKIMVFFYVQGALKVFTQ